MAKLCTHQSSLNLWHNYGWSPSLFLKSGDLSFKGLLQGVPSHVEHTKAELATAGVTRIEVSGINQLLD